MLLRVPFAVVTGMMLVLSMAGFRKRGLSGRENGLAKRLETTGVGKRTFLFVFVRGFTLESAVVGLRMATLGGGSFGGFAGFWISWMRSLTSNEALSTEEVASMGKAEGRNWTVLPKRVPLVAGTYFVIAIVVWCWADVPA